jgi:hypothetical protein
MTATRRAVVLAVVGTALAGMADVQAFNGRDTDIAATEMPAVVLRDGGHDVRDGISGEASYTLAFTVEGFVTGTDEAAIAAAVDDLYGKVVKALVADPTLGGEASDVRHVSMSAPDPLTEDQDAPYAVIELDFEVDFETAENDPYAKP